MNDANTTEGKNGLISFAGAAAACAVVVGIGWHLVSRLFYIYILFGLAVAIGASLVFMGAVMFTHVRQPIAAALIAFCAGILVFGTKITLDTMQSDPARVRKIGIVRAVGDHLNDAQANGIVFMRLRGNPIPIYGGSAIAIIALEAAMVALIPAKAAYDAAKRT